MGPRLAFLRALILAGLVASGGIALSGCSGGGPSFPECEDGLDNDGDGRIDEVDPACIAGGEREAEDPPVACNDGEDNDGDGRIDTDDPGCETPTDTDEFNVRMPACDDGVDNDGDGLTDYPAEPGCLASNEDTEEDDCPDGPGCPQCGDGDDNDGDGPSDFPDDDGCSAASDNEEFMLDADACGVGTQVLELPANNAAAGTISANAPNNVSSVSCNGRGGEIAYLVQVDRAVTMLASTDSGGNLDTVLYIRRACQQSQTELACNDNISPTNNKSRITVDLTPGTYFLVVDARDVGNTGTFQLSVQFFEGLGEECIGPANCAPGYVCRAVPPSTTTTCERPVCSDGRDDDGDTKTDFPIDPGCTSITDDSETDTCPAGPGCPQCGDGVDNDSDGFVDYPMDMSCASAAATVERDCPAETDPIIPITGVMTSGTTVGASNSLNPSCGSSFTMTAPERVHQLDVRVTLSTLELVLTPSFDAAMSFTDSMCSSPPIQCVDPNTISRTNVQPGRYQIIVDGWSSGSGTYGLQVRGTIGLNQPCNDPLVAAGVFTCAAGSACAGPAGMERCVPAACNDTMDADGDGFNGFPTDPGCTSAQDNDETDDCPTGPMCPQCGNDLDDDGDMQTDYPMDFGCVSASGNNEECATVDPIIPFTANVVNAPMAGATNDVDLSCGIDGRDQIHRLRLTRPLSELRVNTVGSALDTILAIKRGGCASFDLQCDDNTAGNGDSAVFLVDVPAGDYYLIVDDRNVASPQSYNLNVSGLYANGQACDPASTIFACNPGFACVGAPGAELCTPAACNDMMDADGDGFNGFPTDPGCTSTSDATEADDCPSGPGCPACSDDVDNDMDGNIDYPMDPSCTSAAADSEFAPCVSVDPVSIFTNNITGATTTGRANDVDLSCGVDGRDEVYRLFITQPLTSLTVDTIDSAMQVALAIRTGTCNGTTDVTCGTNNAGTNDARVSINNVMPGEVFLIVDDLNALAPSTYNLRVTGVIPNAAACNPASQTFVCGSGFACYGPAGMETCQTAACNDAVDADGDGFVGFPSDPGCATISDHDETDNCPSGPGCPACSDDVDNDMDGLTDYGMDLGCSAASTNSEAECQVETDAIIPVTGPTFSGTTAGAANNFIATCGSSFTTTAPDRVHILSVRVPLATLDVNTDPAVLDTTLTLSDATCGPSIVCDDQGGATGNSSAISRTNVVPGAYTFIVDGFAGGSGQYSFNVRGTIAVGNSCEDPLVDAGVFVCATGSACAGTSGARMCVPAACNDTVDADGDGFPGFPTDPGCADVNDNTEADTCPAGPGCPQCSDDVDNDMDGRIDYPMDPGCLSAAANSEIDCPVETDVITQVTGPITTGTTVGAANNFNPSCQTNDLGDRVHFLTLAVPVASLTMDTETSTLTDTVLVFMNSTCGMEFACDDDTGTGNWSVITRTNVAPGNYAIVVDTWGGVSTNPYVLNVRGTIASGSSCADPLVAAGVLTCAAGTSCQAGICSP